MILARAIQTCSTLFAAMLAVGALHAQVYTHPTVGVQSTYSGACLVSTCSGTYYDNGGAAGNYGNNINNIYRTFCPSTAGSCMRATFTSFSMSDTYFLCFGPNSCCDYLQILNGPAQNSPILFSNCTASPGTVTASGASGCLTFRMVSDGSITLPGWAATLSCVPCAGGPSGTSNADCQFATTVCNDLPITDASTGPGIVAQGCSGCNTSEVFTNWYRIRIQTSGTLAFTIDPNTNSDDFDPVLYGPNVPCSGLGTPVRCSYAASAGNGNTGLGNGALDLSEDVFGNQWVAPLNVTAGQVYYLLINGWSANSGSNGFLMDWTGTATLTCSTLPVEMTSFTATCDHGAPLLEWTTATEQNSSHFIIEHSEDGALWLDVGRMGAMGNSSQEVIYQFSDPRPLKADVAYYRLRQVDLDGTEEISATVSVEACHGAQPGLTVAPNPADGLMDITIDLGRAGSMVSELELRDATGRSMMRGTVVLGGGRANAVMDVSRLPKGTYVLSLTCVGEGDPLRTKVIVR